ncbi:uncharacterized protein DUF4034 [Burkholderia pyrrocinia]|uniref:Uncharacterized protein DUF4034 n=2 Tax=Burkholderiaceae TaxID=119060 RepID=A0A318IWI0_BURPY|nr:uncharacterized protein DUF4034 [Burkholderia pyrrocinia]SFW69305.1 protein of unknown function [Burkholderia sp. NFACC33-1]SFY31525.1 protein of unknown function [Burkholderia sp. NFPP32]
MTADTDMSSAPADLIPPAKSRWFICDVDALLRAGDFAALDTQLDAALAASFADRTAEALYVDALPADVQPCIEAGAEGLARLRAWQAANPQSAHAWLCEAHYWHHWAYEYRGSGWAETVTETGWICAHACATLTIVAALRALVLAPTMWSAPKVIFTSVSSFDEPEWLTQLVQQRRWPVTELHLNVGAHDEATRAELQGMLARSGLNPGAPVACPAEFPEALPGPVQGKKLRKGKWYWMEATLHIHPHQFFPMRTFIWYMQPRWGGSHDHVRAFVDSDACAHLDAVEKDRLRHEIWRDDHIGNTLDSNDDDDDARRAMAATLARAKAALHPYHRWETLHWLAHSHFMRSEYEQAYARLREAEHDQPIDDNHAMAMGVRLALDLDPQGTWLTGAIERASDARACTSAMILRGYAHRTGTFGFAQDDARGDAWLEAARVNEPGSLAWNQLASAMRDEGRRPADAVALCELGYEAGGDSCGYLLGCFYEDGMHVTQDLYRAAHYFRESVDDGGNMAAYKLAFAYYHIAGASKDEAERTRMQVEAVEAARVAHEMGHTEGLETMLMFIADVDDLPSRHRYVDELRRHAEGGHPAAMAALSSILADSRDKSLYNYRESVRWIMGAQAIAPDDEYVRNITRLRHEDGMLGKLLYKLHRKQIKAHEIPGNDNAMV